MGAANKAAYEYLVQYCEDARPLGYAVLLNGPWGAGKTHFITKFLAESKIKHLFISLYGMTTTRQIEEEFWRQLHPVLASKPMRLLGALGKGVLKTTIKVDLDGDGKEDGSLSPTIPDIDVVKLADPTGRILVFDDLERCRMGLDEALGYINSLVEHSGFKVIIIANEAEITKKRDHEHYPEIKEKLVGQTLVVKSSVDDALDEFLQGIANEKVHKYLKKNRAKIVEIYNLSSSGNLRVLKHALWDFERFASGFEPKIWKNKDAVSWLLSVVLSLANELRLGRMSAEEITDLFANRMVRYMEQSNRKKTEGEYTPSRVELFEDRYKTISFDQSLYDGRIFAEGLQKGWFDPAVTKEGFRGSGFFIKASDQPAWRTVWSAADVSDHDFAVAFKKMEDQFKRREFLKPGEILHVTGLRLFLADPEILDLSREQVVNESKAYIDDLERSGRLQEGEIDDYISHFGGWDGLGICKTETAEYQEVFTYLQAAMKRVFEESLPIKAMALLADLSKDPELFVGKVVSYGDANVYWRTPLLKDIPVNQFVDSLLSMDPSVQRRVMSSLKSRYDHNALSRELAPEKPWLQELRTELLVRASSAKGIIGWRLAKFVEWNLDPYLPKEPGGEALNSADGAG